MNGLRTRLTLDPALQRLHNHMSRHADRDVGVGAAVIAVILAALLATGVVK